jgi:hypothetical protein
MVTLGDPVLKERIDGERNHGRAPDVAGSTTTGSASTTASRTSPARWASSSWRGCRV